MAFGISAHLPQGDAQGPPACIAPAATPSSTRPLAVWGHNTQHRSRRLAQAQTALDSGKGQPPLAPTSRKPDTQTPGR